MKARIIMLLLLVICVQIAWGLDIPKLKGRVNDFTESTLTVEQRNKLEAKLKAFEESTSNQIAVLIMEPLKGEDLEDFSMEIAEDWRIGQKGKDKWIRKQSI